MLILQRNFTRLNSEHVELEEMLLEEKAQKEKFKNMKNNIEDERRLLDRTVEKLQKEVSVLKCGGQSASIPYNPHRMPFSCPWQIFQNSHLKWRPSSPELCENVLNSLHL